MMETIGTIVRLRWALTIAAMRKSAAQTVGYVVGILMAAGVVVWVGTLAWSLGSSTPETPGVPAVSDAAFVGGFNVAVVLAGSFLTLAVVIVQVLYLGQGSTLSPGRFALYGIPDRTLSLGLLVAGLTGLPAIAGLVSLLLWASVYRQLGPGPVVAQIVAAPIAVVVMMSLSKVTIAAATSLVRSTRGKNAFYIVVVLVFVLACQVPGLMVGGAASADMDPYRAGAVVGIDPAAFAPSASIFAWTPLGAAFQLPFDVLSGAWGAFAGRLAVLAATVVLCFMGSTACLRHDRLTTGAATATVTLNGLGAFRRTHDSVSGAVAARLMSYLRRDPRQALLFAMPLILVALMAFQAHAIGDPVIVWIGLMMGGWFMFIAEGNGMAYDGCGYAMEVMAGVRGFDDRLGRVRLLALLAGAYVLVLGVLIIVFTGDWRDGHNLRTALMFLGFAWGLSYASLGIAEVVSVTLMYPVPSIDKPFSAPQGRAVAQGLFPLVQMLGTPLLMLPTIVVTVAVGVTVGFRTDLTGLLGLFGLANGVAVLALGTWLGGKLLEARSLSVLRTLEGFASLQQ